MKGYVVNIEKETLENEYFRKVLYTAKNTQLVLMSIKPGDEIGDELHELDQFIRVEKGKATAILNKGKTEYNLEEDHAIIIPAGTWHNIINTGTADLKLYTLYCPPEHKDGTVHATKEEAVEEHFDGKLTESS
ncbi:cupin domain-containing protein [candidate division WWE3 bacterium]|jgi:mannose-6-phosphate isomerase-like protein (cupin superfamily)|uniref:Cupin domain-containing protein n=1 Tax=candidate division WWE3 bacterium TaxID=2053526 RepID=A0A3A4ZJR3_UNCKA|nr:MAG: cupin domain-containing protein [candidate division WWE3 bacterium]